jgi:hypothetical protein
MKTLIIILCSATLFFGCKKTVEESPDFAPTIAGTYIGSYKTSKGFQSSTYQVVISKNKVNNISMKGVNDTYPNSAIAMELANIETSQTDGVIPMVPVATNKATLIISKDISNGIVIEGKSNPPGSYGGFYYEVGTKKVVNIFFKIYKVEEPENVTEINFEGIKK